MEGLRLNSTASSSEIEPPASVAMYFKSAPAMNAGLADAMMAPRMAASPATRSIAAIMSPMNSGDTTFIERPGSSKVMSAMPSASTSSRRVFRFIGVR